MSATFPFYLNADNVYEGTLTDLPVVTWSKENWVFLPLVSV